MKKILIATDFSENAKHALQYAVMIARRTEGTITLLHEHDNRNGNITGLPAENEKCLDENRMLLDKLAGEVIPAEIEFNCVSHSGDAVKLIPQFALENKYTLIVMGNHGNNRLSRLIMGSTASGVIKISQVPVLVVPEKANIKIPEDIVFAYDGNKLDNETAMQLKEITEALQAKLDVVNVISDLAVKPVDEKRISAEIYEALKPADYNLHFTENGDVLQGIVNYMAENESDAVAMIYHPKSFISNIFTGSHTNRMAFYTHKPLFILPETKFISRI